MLTTGCGGVNERQIASIEWRQAGALSDGNGQAEHIGLAGPLSGIHNNVLIVGGGANFPDAMPWLGGKKRYYDDIHVFKRSDNGDYSLLKGKRFKMPYRAAYGASCSTVKGVLYAGGENEEGLISTVLLIRYEDRGNEIVFETLPNLPFSVTNASVATDGSKVYLAGGETVDGVSDKLFYLDLNAPPLSWTTLTTLPQPVSHSVLTLQADGSDRSLYLIGGRKKNNNGLTDFFPTNYRFNLAENRWQQMASLPYAISAGTGWSDGDCEILLFGGDAGKTFHRTEELILAISRESDPPTKEMLNQQKAVLQATHPGFSKEILRYDVCSDAWSVIGAMPFDVPVTTTAVVAGDDEVLIPSGEIKAGVRTPRILQGKISFDSLH